MTCVDLLSDTIYCEQAVKQLDQLLGDSNRFPVGRGADLWSATNRQTAA